MKTMKFFAIAIAAATFVFSGCNKDEDKVETPTSLVGTTWKYEVSGVGVQAKFTSDTRCTYSVIASSTSTGADYDYTYSIPNLTIKVSAATGGAMSDYTGVVDGNKMTINVSMSGVSYSYTLTKQ